MECPPSHPQQYFPSHPFVTTFITPSDKTGNFEFGITVHKGNPGLYGFSLEADAVSSNVVLFHIPSKLHSAKIDVEPSQQVFSFENAEAGYSGRSQDFASGLPAGELRCGPLQVHRK